MKLKELHSLFQEDGLPEMLLYFTYLAFWTWLLWYLIDILSDSLMLELILVQASPLPSPPFRFPAYRKTDA